VKQKLYVWDEAKNQRLKAERNISFEEAVSNLASGNVLDIIKHPNQKKYKGQHIFIVKMHDYVWLVRLLRRKIKFF